MAVSRCLRFDVPDDAPQHSLNNEAFIFPSFMYKPIIVLPPSLVPWIISQKDDTVSFQAAVTDVMTFNITSLDERISTDPTHTMVVSGPLTRSLSLTPAPVMEEVMLAVDEFWGAPTTFTDMKLFDTLLKVVSRTSNRIFVGSDLC